MPVILPEKDNVVVRLFKWLFPKFSSIILHDIKEDQKKKESDK